MNYFRWISINLPTFHANQCSGLALPGKHGGTALSAAVVSPKRLMEFYWNTIVSAQSKIVKIVKIVKNVTMLL